MKRPCFKGITVALMAVLGLGGCSGSGSGGVTPPVATRSGKVVDGYVSGAKVTLDQNDDRICQATEVTTTTDADGNYFFAVTLGQHMVCASGGVDIHTGQPFIGEVMAPAGATQITPLTSLIMAKINEANPPVAGVASPVAAVNVAAVAGDIANSLGLEGTNLLVEDPVQLAHSKPELLQVTAAVQVLMVQTASILQAASGDDTARSGNAQTNGLYAEALKAVAAVLAAQPVDSISKLSQIGAEVLEATTITSQSNPALLTALPGIASLQPASVAAFVGPALEAVTNAVAMTSATVLVDTSAGNQNMAAAAIASPVIAKTVGAVASTLLTTAAATTFSPAELTAIAGSALPVSTEAAGELPVTSGTAAEVVAAIQTVEPAATISVETKIALSKSAELSNASQLSYVRINCRSACQTYAYEYGEIKSQGRLVSKGALSDVTLGLAPPRGNAVNNAVNDSRVKVSLAAPVGTGPGEALAGTQFDTPILISIYDELAATGTTAWAGLQLELDHAVLFQTNSDAGNASLIPLADQPYLVGDDQSEGQPPLIHKSGKYLYQWVSGAIHVFLINAISGELTPAGSLQSVTGVRSMVLTPDGKFLLATKPSLHGTAVYAINTSTGGLTEVAGSPFATGFFPGDIAIDPSGRFVFVRSYAELDGNQGRLLNVGSYILNATSGELSAQKGAGGVGVSVQPEQWPIAASGTALYTTDMLQISDSGPQTPGVFAWKIDSSNGNLDLMSRAGDSGIGLPTKDSFYSVPGRFPIGVAVDPSGKFLFVVCKADSPTGNGETNGLVSAFTINSNGTLTRAGAAVETGDSPESVIVDPSGKFVYVASWDGAISIYSINRQTGALQPTTKTISHPNSIPAVQSKIGVAIAPDGKTGYMLGYNVTPLAFRQPVLMPFAIDVETTAIGGFIPDSALLTVSYSEGDGTRRSATISGSTLNAGKVVVFDYKSNTVKIDISALLDVIGQSAAQVAPKLTLLTGLNGGNSKDKFYSVNVSVPGLVLDKFGRETRNTYVPLTLSH